MWLSNSGVAAGSHGCGAGGAALAVIRVINRRCLAGGQRSRIAESVHFTRGLEFREDRGWLTSSSHPSYSSQMPPFWAVTLTA